MNIWHRIYSKMSEKKIERSNVSDKMGEKIMVKIKTIATGLFLIIFLILSGQSFAATLYVVASGGAGSGSCPIGTPCTLSRALAAVSAGDTIIVNPGDYGSLSLSGTNHSNITVTTTGAVKSALTFVRGLVTSGTDNRPQFTGLSISGSATGVTVEYLRFRGGAAPAHWGGGAIIDLSAPGSTIQYVEVYNGGYGVFFHSQGPYTIRHFNCHDMGPMGDTGDEHCVYARSLTRANTGWNEQYLIEESTLGPNVSGDGIQPGGSAQYEGRNDPYWEIKNVDFLGPFDEQCIDSKGANYVKIHGIDCVKNFDGVFSPLTNKRTGYEYEGNGSGINTTYGEGSAIQVNNYWWIWNNRIHGNPLAGFYMGGQASTWYIWNNLIYDNAYSCPFGGNGSKGWMLPGNSYFIYNVVYNNTNQTGGTCNVSGLNPGNSGDNVKNNIFYNNGLGSYGYGSIRKYSSEDTGTPSYNYVYPTTCSGGNCQTGINAITSSDPGFVNLEARNFHLLTASVNKSVATSVSNITAGGFSTSFDIDADGATRGTPLCFGAYGAGYSTGLANPTDLHFTVPTN